MRPALLYRDAVAALRRRVTVTPGFWLAAAAALYLDGAIAVLSALAALVHELAHWGAARLLGGRVRSLRLSFVGAEMAMDPRVSASYPREILTALAGPAAGLIAALLAAQWGWYLFAGLSMALSVFNLLPVLPLDGGRVVWAAAALLWHEGAAARLCAVVSALVTGALLGLGAALALREGNFTLLLTAVWLLLGLLRQ